MFYFPGVPAGCYSAPKDLPGVSCEDPFDLNESAPQAIYDIYDALAQDYPQFVKKQALGLVSGLEMNRYSFSNFPLDNASPFPHEQFKICIVTSIHGSEKGCAWTAAKFFDLMYRSCDPHLQFLRRNVVFEVLPVANPYGFANNQRKNENEVDLNRNFAAGFIPGKDISSTEYGGPFPYSETETQLVMQFIEDNLDARVVLDYHNMGKRYPLFFVYGQKDVQLAYGVFTMLTDQWQAEYPEFSGNRLIGYVRPNGNEGMFADYLLEKKLWPITLETPMKMPVIGKEKYDAVTMRCALELLVNTLMTIVTNPQ